MSGSRFLRPELSRFFNEVARNVRQPISRFLAGAALPPPSPGIRASRFLTNPQTPPTQAAINAGTPTSSRFLQPELSGFIKQVSKVRAPISRFMTRTAALLPPVPEFFSSRFFGKPPTPPRQLRRGWPRKPDGPKF
jgi:hypothetical protein